jgi:hypothetical protein
LVTDAQAQFRPGGRRAKPRPSASVPPPNVPPNDYRQKSQQRDRPGTKVSAPSAPSANTSTAESLYEKLNGSESEASVSALALEERLSVEGRRDEANTVLTRAIQRFPENLELIERAANRARSIDNGTESRAIYERALLRVSNRNKRLWLLTQLRTLAVESNALAEARKYHEQLLVESKTAATHNESFVKTLIVHHHPDEAKELLEGYSGGPNRQAFTAAELWFELARLERAMSLTDRAQSSFARARFYLASQPQKTSSVRRLLATIESETGQFERALEWLRGDPALREQYCQTLEISGRLDEALTCFEAQVRKTKAPLDRSLVLVNQLLDRRENARARSLLIHAEQARGSKPEDVTRLANAWERLGDPRRAKELIDRNPATKTHVIGRQVLFTGQPSRANLPHLWLEEAEEAVETGQVEKALHLIDGNLDPSTRNTQLLIRTAKVLERAVVNGKTRDTSLYDRAEVLFREVLKNPNTKATELSTAIEHLVRNWTLQGKLELRTKELNQSLTFGSGSLPYLLLLAEAEYRREHAERAMAILLIALNTSHTPWPLLSRLERITEAQGHFNAALEFAERRLNAPERSERSNYATLVEYAEKTRQPLLALRYAQRWTLVEPQLGAAWASLAKQERLQQPIELSRETMKHAYDLDRNRFEYLSILASWYKADNDFATASALALTILSTDTDELRLIAAYEMALSLASTREQRVTLEQTLRSALVHVPGAQRLRDALLSLYFDLLFQEPASQAPATEREVAQRATRVLVESLTDPRKATQETALRLLERFPSKEAAIPLFRFATDSNTEETLSVRALKLLGHLRAPEVLPLLLTWFKESEHRRDSNARAKLLLYCLLQYRDRSASELLLTLVKDDTSAPELITMSLLGLSERGEATTTPLLKTLLRTPSTPPHVRAVAALGLFQLSPKAPELDPSLSQAPTRALRLVELFLLAAQHETASRPRIAELLSSDAFADPMLFEIASRLVDSSPLVFDASLKDPDVITDPDAAIVLVLRRPTSPLTRLHTLEQLLPDLVKSLSRNITFDPIAAKRLGRFFLGDGTTFNLGPLLPTLESLPPAVYPLRERLLSELSRVTSDDYRAYRHHSDPELRELSIGIAALTNRDPLALLDGFADPNEGVCEKAIFWSKTHNHPRMIDAIVARFTSEPNPRIRTLLTERLGEVPRGSLTKTTVFTLTRAMRQDPSASVRLAALTALVHNNPVAAKRELSYGGNVDQEPEFKAVVKKLLESGP